MSCADFLCPDVALDAGCTVAKRSGDRVMIGRNRGPLYEIVHLCGDTAWIRGIDYPGRELLAPVANLRFPGAAVRRLAA